MPVSVWETGNLKVVIFNPAILAACPVLRAWCGLVLFLRCSVLDRRGLLALLLPVAELVLIVPGLGRVSFLHRRSRF